MEPEKIRPIAGNDRPILVIPRGILLEQAFQPLLALEERQGAQR
jgi:hypothetical protein